MKKPLTVLLWKWKTSDKPTTNGWKFSIYDYRHVNAVVRMVRKNYKAPHRILAIVDDPDNPGYECETVSLYDTIKLAGAKGDILYMPGIIGGTWCRLITWSSKLRQLLGPRIISLDLDCVIVGDLAPLFEREEKFIGWLSFGDRKRPVIYNASVWAADTDAYPDVWNSFHAKTAVQELAKAGYNHEHGTEQAWMSYKLGPRQPAWTYRDGVVSFRYQLRKRRGVPLIKGSRIVFFHGPKKPLDIISQVPWVAKHYLFEK